MLNYFLARSGFEACDPPDVNFLITGLVAPSYGSLTYRSPMTLGFSAFDSSAYFIGLYVLFPEA